MGEGPTKCASLSRSLLWTSAALRGYEEQFTPRNRPNKGSRVLIHWCHPSLLESFHWRSKSQHLWAALPPNWANSCNTKETSGREEERGGPQGGNCRFIWGLSIRAVCELRSGRRNIRGSMRTMTMIMLVVVGNLHCVLTKSQARAKHFFWTHYQGLSLQSLRWWYY